jgi:hypothetical protein
MHLPAETPPRCKNCGAPLHGPFCAGCGQEAHGSARSLGTLFHDAWHSLTHLDGRLWRTLRALVLRPGLLTVEYLADRRARFLPPFRLYLVISVLFFAIAAAGSAGTDPAAVARVSADPGKVEGARPRVDEVTRELEASGQGALADVLRGASHPDGGRIDPRAACEWLGGGGRVRRALLSSCERAMQDSGRALGHAFAANVPKTMILFLPVVALVLFALFGRSRRFFVEHLVLVLHLQSALFLAASAALALDAALGWSGGPDALSDLATLAVWVYCTWYAYRALRLVYGEGRAETLAKLAALGLAYGVLLASTLVGTALVSALTA